MSFILTLSSLFSLQLIWRMSTEILHHHPNSTIEDYNNIYERLKHSGVRHYLLVCHLVNLITSQRSFGLFLFSWGHLSFFPTRFVWNMPSTYCSTVRLKMQSSSCLELKAGGMGRSQRLSSRRPNWSRPTGAFWITSSGVTKSLRTPKTVRPYTPHHPEASICKLISYTRSCCVMWHWHLQAQQSNCMCREAS